MCRCAPVLQPATPIHLLGQAGLHVRQALLQTRSDRLVHGLQVGHLLLPLQHLQCELALMPCSEHLQVKLLSWLPPMHLRGTNVRQSPVLDVDLFEFPCVCIWT